MPKLSAGRLIYRLKDNVLEVLIVHPGGPFWAKKDEAAWSIPKGEYEDDEDPRAVAEREFVEELGSKPSVSDEEIFLGEVKQPSGKRVTVWAQQGDFDATTAVSNTFEMEWPRGSGRIQEFPEVDRAHWFSVADARIKLLKGHRAFLDLLLEKLGERGIVPSEGVVDGGEQSSLF